MKKLLCALVICALCIGMLAACGRQSASDGAGQTDTPVASNPEVTLVPEEGGHGEQDQSLALADMPTLAPAVPLDADDDDDVDDDDDIDDGDDDDEYYSMDALINGSDAENAEEGDASEAGDAAEAPVQRPGSMVIDPNTVQFSAMDDPELKLTFNYPSDWVNVPGVYTVCYREMVEPGDYPARVAITAKLLIHSPE